MHTVTTTLPCDHTEDDDETNASIRGCKDATMDDATRTEALGGRKVTIVE